VRDAICRQLRVHDLRQPVLPVIDTNRTGDPSVVSAFATL
jgi:hypothetical protein